VFVIEEEFQRVLRVMGRPENTLSAVLRQAWDGNRLGIMTRNRPIRAEGATVSLVAHITLDELRTELTDMQAVNGFGNRLLFCLVRRSKELPFGGNIGQSTIDELTDRLRAAMDLGGTGAIHFDEAARQKWIATYAELTAELPGMFGALVARSEAQAVRVALIYALLDGQRAIGTAHLDAALEIIRYSNDSVRHIFGDATGNRVADAILGPLRSIAPEPMSRSQISNELFVRNVKAADIMAALELLRQMGKIRLAPSANTGGRPGQLWRAT
jgi:hypothetical protein